MKRFIKVDIGGIPYVNTDFTEIFQREHLVSYKGMLDSLNKDSYTGRNSGIILKGCEITNSNPGGFQMNFTSSLIYLNGDFLEYDPLSSVEPTISSSTFYLYQLASQSDDRYLRDLTTQVSVAETSHFSYTTTEPPTGEYIRFSSRGTSRHYKRILKFATSDYGDIYITSNTQSFSATGLGFNDMDGFHLLNGQDPSQYMDLSGKFIRGQSNKVTTNDFVNPNYTEYQIPNAAGIPQVFNIDTTYLKPIQSKNFPLSQNTALLGSTSVSLRLNDLPKHQHLGIATTYSMTHSHALETTFNNREYLNSFTKQDIDPTNPDPSGMTNPARLFYISFAFTQGFLTDGGNLRATASSLFGSGFSFSAWGVREDVLYNSFMRARYVNQTTSRLHHIYTHGVNSHYLTEQYFNSRNQYLQNPSSPRADLYTHTHSFTSVSDVGIGNIGDDAAPHENRPSYRVMAFYTKKYIPPVNIIRI